MGPIEILWFVLIGLFMLVGAVRGFLKELGVTIVLVATLFGLDRLIPLVEQLIRDGRLQAIGLKPFTENPQVDQPTNLLLTIIFQLILLAAVFIAYQGETLAYEGTNPKFPTGLLLSLMVGAVNGYLIAGTLWWILDHYHYPVPPTIYQPPLTAFAQGIIDHKLLPLELLGAGTQSVDSLGLLPIILVALIVLKVAR